MDGFKGIVHPKILIPSSFIHPHAIKMDLFNTFFHYAY